MTARPSSTRSSRRPRTRATRRTRSRSPRRSPTTKPSTSCSRTRTRPRRSPPRRATCTTTPEAGSAASAVLDAIAAARRSKAPEDDYDLTKAHDEGTLGEAPLPASVDLREPWHEVPQQGHTASCVGWSLADSVLRWHLVKAGRLAPDAHLSARHIWMSAKETDAREDYPSTFLEEDGTSLKAGLEVIRKFGAVLDSELPWEGKLAAGSPDAFNTSAASRRIVAYFNLYDDDKAKRFSAWRRWLAEHGPVAVLFKMDAQIETGKLQTLD